MDYAELGTRVRALTVGETDVVALMATLACEIHHFDARFDWTGFYRVTAPAAIVPEDGIEIAGPVRWYRSSETARRGFCPRCGASLFWQAIGSGRMDFALGAVDGPTGLHLARHIFTEDKGDYYAICEREHPQEGE